MSRTLVTNCNTCPYADKKNGLVCTIKLECVINKEEASISQEQALEYPLICEYAEQLNEFPIYARFNVAARENEPYFEGSAAIDADDRDAFEIAVKKLSRESDIGGHYFYATD